MSFELATSTDMTALLANVVTVFGENFPAILIVVGAVAAIPLSFYVGGKVLGLIARITRSANR